MVWAGAGSMRIDDRPEIALHPGLCIWMRPGHHYLAEQDPNHRLGVSFIHFNLSHSNTKERTKDHEQPPFCLDTPDLLHSEATVTRLLTLCPPPRTAAQIRPAATAIFRGLALDILDHWQRPEPRPAAQLHPVTREHFERQCLRLRESPKDCPTVTQLAHEAGYSTDHYSRLFKQFTRYSPQAFIVESRKQRADLLLRDTDMTIQEIADALGYRDLFFFSRQYKQYRGQPPSAVRS